MLDIGSGIRLSNVFRATVHICVEPFETYVKVIQNRYQNHPNVIILQSDGLSFAPTLPDGSVDSVFLVDVIEHMTKEQGFALLAQCERIARKQIAVFTPLGYMPQDYGPEEADA